MEQATLIREINAQLALQLPLTSSFDQLKQALAVTINHLIQTDFDKLISILYRMDVSEKKLKTLLNGQVNENAGNIIADLMIERQLEKIKTRRQFSQRDNDIDEEEKW